jgi:hypothetical protein
MNKLRGYFNFGLETILADVKYKRINPEEIARLEAILCSQMLSSKEK